MTQNLNIWNGSSWNPALGYVWDGVNWQSVNGYVWDGTVWQQFLNKLNNAVVVAVGKNVSGYTTIYGYDLASSTGSINPNRVALLLGSQIVSLNWYQEIIPVFGGTITLNFLTLTVNSLLPNSGWTNITIGGNTFVRSSANYSQNTGANQTTWTWSGNPANPFGTTIGANVNCVFA